MKVMERVIEKRIRSRVQLDDMQFEFRPGTMVGLDGPNPIKPSVFFWAWLRGGSRNLFWGANQVFQSKVEGEA